MTATILRAIDYRKDGKSFTKTMAISGVLSKDANGYAVTDLRAYEGTTDMTEVLADMDTSDIKRAIYAEFVKNQNK